MTVAPLLFLLLLAQPFLLPAAHAQSPLQDEENLYRASLHLNKSAVHIDYLGSATLNLRIDDISQTRPSPAQPQGRISLDTEVLGQPPGWTAYTSVTQFLTSPGDSNEVNLIIQPGATIEDAQARVRVTAVYDAPNGEEFTTNVTVLAVAKPNPIVRLQLSSITPEFSPNEQNRIPIEVRNDDYYPEMVSFRVQAPEGWVVSPPSAIQLAPGETETVYVDVKAPEDPWFRFNPTSEVFIVTAQTESYGEGRHSVGVPVSLGGAFLPGWVIPHLFLLGIGLLVVGRRSIGNAREHRLEKGKPSYPGLPPEKEARFEALKVAAPSKAETMEERLERLYKKRKEAWKDYYKERKDRARERRREAQKSHDAVLAKKREKEKRRKQAEERKRKQLEKRRKRKQELLEKKRKAQARAEKERDRQQDELAKELREERRRLQSEVSQAGEDAPTDAELQAKRERLEELKRKKRQLEEEEGSS